MDSNTIHKIGLFTILFIGIIALGLSVNHNKENVTKAEISYMSSLQKIDSLQSVINDLQAELESEEEGFDRKEQRYEDILFEYEYGIERLKETHPSAYKEFHRIIAFKERYSVETKKENQKRLKW